MSMNEGSMKSGSLGLGEANESTIATLRANLKKEIDRISSTNDLAMTGEFISTLQIIQAIFDDLDSRLTVIENSKGIDGGTY